MILNQNSLDPPHIWDKWATAGRGQYEESSLLITPHTIKLSSSSHLSWTINLIHVFHFHLKTRSNFTLHYKTVKCLFHVWWLTFKNEVKICLSIVKSDDGIRPCVFVWTHSDFAKMCSRWDEGGNQNIVCNNPWGANWPESLNPYWDYHQLRR